MVENDSIEYEIVNWKRREIWKCQGACKRFRHRDAIQGTLPAVCCGVPAKLIDCYSQPAPLVISEPVSEALPLRDEGIESIMAEMQAAALLFVKPIENLQKGAYKS